MLALLCLLLLAPGCPPGGSQGGILRWEAYADLVSSTPILPVVLEVGPGLSLADAETQANALGCGVEIHLPGPATGDLLLSARCADPDALGIRVSGPGPLSGGIRAYCVGPDCAWVSVEGLAVTAANNDAFDADGEAKLAVIGSTGWVSGLYSNVLTTHGDSRLLALNVSGGVTGADVAPPIAITADSRATLIGTGSFSTGFAPYDGVVNLGGSNGGTSHLTLVGVRLSCAGTQQSSVDFEPGGGGHATLESAQVTFDCDPDLRLNGLSEHVSWQSIQDDLAGIQITFPAELNSRIELDLSAHNGVDLTLAQPIPTWVDGAGASVVRVYR